MHLYILLLLQLIYYCSSDLQQDIALELRRRNSTSLFRTRRYLTFPEGSSFQVVFDLAYPTLDGIGLYVFGNTAALAWELPSTPIFLDKKFKKKEEPEPTTTMLPLLEHPVEYDWQPPLSSHDTRKIDYYQHTSSWGNKVDYVQNYERPRYRTKFEKEIDNTPVSSYSNPFKGYGNRQKGFKLEYMHSNGYPVQYIKQDNNRRYTYKSNPSEFWDRRSFQAQRNYIRRNPIRYGTPYEAGAFEKNLLHSAHRRTRRELYSKLEEFLAALMKDGKSCILKAICQVNKKPKGKGTLLEELLKTIFKVKPDDYYVDEDHYDRAANVSHDCERMYPECEGNIISKVINTALKK